ncbi:MAG: UDP-N-acetylmuramate--L-alanine ligase [Candidatus Portnoybacteria bacterium CG10_big_fil_rev_8_21_14_0_10_44_7]|uniref:UDP-N-acetylmuramate--L-alanine ligase n=1 Tax=Candidatus Portnoybacteria bacterium CG10_big_fil_rev_8_21_14_0_10_44_7 TaxID=1974816 RepID=A0A2M8KJ62_9BACT|nr:MAG: UDP-N-acetylmuramate--L-alanine ligase [Candidatus Portnoybacteria bacterium CG10_big_fil_rev_8_21_14_0_10_44_7]
MMNIHFIGIGGIGMSALAQYFLNRGAAVFGSDLVDGEMIKLLRQKGARVKIGQPRAGNINRNIDLVIYTSAVAKNNPELLAAKKRKITTQSYAQALGRLTKEMTTVAVAGMHGKSTTTAMLAVAAVAAGLDPTVILGTRLPEFGGSNFRAGRSNLLIIEADEYKAALLRFYPDVAVVLNIDREHLDFYRGLEHIKKTFRRFLSQLKPGGAAILNRDDQNLKTLLPASFWRTGGGTLKWFSIYDQEVDKIKKVLKVPGRHNLSNALAVYQTLRFLGVSSKKILAGIGKFKGSWRRLEYKGQVNGAKIYDDYGHHPTEIKATIQAAREILKANKLKAKSSQANKLWLVFQPHQYKRTHQLFTDFRAAFSGADEVLLLDIYSVAGRESAAIKRRISTAKLVRAINRKNIHYVPSFSRAVTILKQSLQPGDLCLIMGAGDVWRATLLLTKK